MATTLSPTKPATSLPTPERISNSMYYVPSFNEGRRAKGVRYAVVMTEYGWRCSNRWCANEYNCMHTNRVDDYRLEQEIMAALPEPAVRPIKAADTLISLFDYAAR